MARRRYLSTDISTDTRVNALARTAGDFAALLYTWMIPHAGDDGALAGDPEELLLIVCPGRRDKEPEDVAAALAAMAELDLIVWDRDARLIRFPESFYRHQSYITEKRRGSARAAPAGEASDSGGAQQRTSAHVAAEPRTSPQNAASFSFSSSSSSSSSVSPSREGNAPQPPKPKPRAAPKPAAPAADAAASEPYRLFQALCEETGADESQASPATKSKACGFAKRILADGFDEAAVRGCIRWLQTQTWRESLISLQTVEAEIGGWHLAGRPATAERDKPRGNGRASPPGPAARTEQNIAEFRRRVGVGPPAEPVGEVIEAQGRVLG